MYSLVHIIISGNRKMFSIQPDLQLIKSIISLGFSVSKKEGLTHIVKVQ